MVRCLVTILVTRYMIERMRKMNMAIIRTIIMAAVMDAAIIIITTTTTAMGIEAIRAVLAAAAAIEVSHGSSGDGPSGVAVVVGLWVLFAVFGHFPCSEDALVNCLSFCLTFLYDDDDDDMRWGINGQGILQNWEWYRTVHSTRYIQYRPSDPLADLADQVGRSPIIRPANHAPRPYSHASLLVTPSTALSWLALGPSLNSALRLSSAFL